ncbi:hypothetical protein K457DRAFT_33851 [Linnemannia elongata AG-77]|uniref:Uncharacterized protein n=1 Tax=Linnemannia elongata AG-77 TaxID=1314771 RepID=A0A197JR18_9FUNG|nr:hypothetical protein K457DRAFT_33851 [Linnemannia elongata AG-77]
MSQGTATLPSRLWLHWPQVVIVTLSLYSLLYSVQGLLRTLNIPPESLDKVSPRTYYAMFFYKGLGVAIGLQRLHVAYRPSTGLAQFAFNIWLVSALLRGAFMVCVYSYAYFVPSLMERLNNATALEQNRTLEAFPQQPTMTATPQSTTMPALVVTMWKGVESWIPSVLNMALGFALWTMLMQRQQLDYEQEVRWEQQGNCLLSANGDLPAPVASASTVEGFKTEAEIRRLRLRVPTWPRLFVGVWLLARTIDGISHISHLSGGTHQAEWAFHLVQGIAGLYVIYSKTLIHTQWLFYSICATTFHAAFRSSIEHWNEDFADTLFPPKDSSTGEKLPEEVAFFRAVKMIVFNAFYVSRLWVAWRLVGDLKARDARVARARREQ